VPKLHKPLAGRLSKPGASTYVGIFSPMNFLADKLNTAFIGHSIVLASIATSLLFFSPESAKADPSLGPFSVVAHPDLEVLTFDPALMPRQDRVLTGSGFFVGPAGIFITAWHVIKDRKVVLVRVANDTRWRPTKLLKTDEERDLALLQVMIDSTSSPPLPLALSPDLPIGLEAYVLGFPLPRVQGDSMKMTQGIVNGFGGRKRGARIIQISAQVHKGSSGGPVLAPDGLVIGIVQKKLDAVGIAKKVGDLPQNVNFALRSSEIAAFLDGASVEYKTQGLDFSVNKRPYKIFAEAMSSIGLVIAFDN
jgi:S1-C subfamily serine protease